MSPAEFTTWLRGFLDAIEGPMTAAQAEKIRAKLAEVSVAPPAPIVEWLKFGQQVTFPTYPTYPAQPLVDPITPWIPITCAGSIDPLGPTWTVPKVNS